MNQLDPSFNDEQENYLKGFFQGISQRTVHPLGGSHSGGEQSLSTEEKVFGTPIDDLCKEETIKFERNGLDVWDTITKNAEKNVFPEGGDVFRYKFYGLFHVTPAQDSFMLRCRIPGGKLLSHQMIGLAEIAENWGGGYLDVTTRANFQIREIMPEHTAKIFTKLTDLGLTSKGSGADNVRNITASPTAGFDPQELIDVMPHAREMHHAILNNRDLYGMPRKFNIAYDGGGTISACADTNDIAFYAVQVDDGHSVDPGVYFRVQLCGITGHKQFASDCGILIKPEQHAQLASAMLRVFIQNGNRTDRNKARLKYLIDDWGQEKYLNEVQKLLNFELLKFDLGNCKKRLPTTQGGHLGVYPQSNPDFFYIGIKVPVGRLQPETLNKLATIASQYGRGEIRLTVWQNLIIPYIHKSQIAELKQAVRGIGLDYETNPFAGGLIACTGNTGCKFAAANTKGQAVILANELSARVKLDHPINIHLTGCKHSCAQHYIGDIGLIGAPSQYNGEPAEGYSIVFGGGVEERQGIAREIFKSIPFQEIPDLLESCLRTYLSNRNDGEDFNQFVRRHSIEELTEIFKHHAA